MSGRTIIVLAKAPQAGRSKTRLCPPLTPGQAAEVAAAMVADTLAVVDATSAARRVLVLDGPPGAWLPSSFEVIPQCGDALDERLAHAFADVLRDGNAPTVLVGMDTPQLTPALLDLAFERLALPNQSAVLGPAADGGWWLVGLRQADRRAFAGVPMSTSTTGAVSVMAPRSSTVPDGSMPTSPAPVRTRSKCVPGSVSVAAIHVARSSPSGGAIAKTASWIGTQRPSAT